MTCEQVREELVACWACVDELTFEVVEHLEQCDACRREAVLLRHTRVMLHSSMPPLSAPVNMAERVMSRIDEQAHSAGWLPRAREWFVPRRQPSWARAAAVGTALALAVAGGALWRSQRPDQSAPPSPPAVVADAGIDGSAARTATLDGELDELMLQHQRLEMTQPLADDAGVSLVVYTSR